MSITFFTETFTRANETPLAAPWASVNSSINLVSNRARASVNDGSQCIARYGAFNVADMGMSVALATLDGNQAGAGVRCSSTAMTLYTAVSAGNTIYLEKIVAGGFTDIGSGAAGTTTAGDRIACDAQGSSISAYLNGSVIKGPVTDSVIASGTWAIRMSTTGTLANLEIDDAIMETYEPVFMGAGAEGSAASGNITLGEPTYASGFTKANDDIWIAVVHSSDQVAHSFTNWTQIVQGNGGGTTSRLSVWYFRYAGSNPNFSVTHASGQTPIGGIAAFRGCKTSGNPAVVGSINGGTTDANIVHTTITPEVDSILLLCNGSADDNNRTLLSGYTAIFSEAGPTNAYLSTAGTPDGSVSMFYKGGFDASATGSITVVQAAVDPWAAVQVSMAIGAAAPTPKTANLAADALGSYADAITVERRGPFRWNDSVVFDKQDVAGITPKTADCPPDALGSYTDATPTLTFTFSATPSADAMTMADQAPTIREGNLYAPGADSLGLYTDQPPTIIELNSVAPSADSLGLYADQAPTIREGNLVTPAADSLPAYVDSNNPFLTFAAAQSDALNQWADQGSVSTLGAITVPLSDSLGLYSDQAPTIRLTFAATSSDDLNQWTDQRTVSAGGLLQVDAPADNLAGYVDSAARQLTGAYSLALPADSMTQADQLSISLLVIKSASLSDGLANYADQIAAAEQKAVGVSDALGSYSDALASSRAINISRVDALANWADQLSGGTAGTTRIGWVDSVNAVTRPVRVGWIDSVTVFRSLGNQRVVDLTSIKPIPLDSPSLQLGLNHGYVVYLTDENGNYFVDENGNRFLVSGLIDNLQQHGDSVAMTRTTLNLTPLLVPLTDSNSAYGDSLQVNLGIVTLTVPLSDALATYGDLPVQVIEVGFLIVAMSDNLAAYSDALALTTTGEKRLALSDVFHAYSDSFGVGYSGALTVSFGDSLENYVDASAVNTSGALHLPLSDTLAAYGDTLGILKVDAQAVSLSDAITPPTDALGVTLGIRNTATDNLAGYADSPTHARGLFYSTLGDSLANYLDLTTIGGSGLLQAALSDNLGQYSDQPPKTFANFRAQPLADDLASYGDALTDLLGINYERFDGLLLGVRFPDEIEIRAGTFNELRFELSDQMDQWLDAPMYHRSYFAIHLAGKTSDQINLMGKVVEERIGINGKIYDKADISGELYIGEP